MCLMFDRLIFIGSDCEIVDVVKLLCCNFPVGVKNSESSGSDTVICKVPGKNGLRNICGDCCECDGLNCKMSGCCVFELFASVTDLLTVFVNIGVSFLGVLCDVTVDVGVVLGVRAMNRPELSRSGCILLRGFAVVSVFVCLLSCTLD